MSQVEVDKIIPQSGTTLTVGDSGDTISIPSGVTLDASSGGLAGTLTTAAQPNITSVGTLTSFTSTGIDDNADATAITIDSSERVGIGTTTPGVKLEIKGADGDADAQAIRLMENSTQGGFIKYDGNANELQLGGFNSGENTGIRIARNDATTMFNTNGSERMRIDDSGNVGIGTSSPASELEIEATTPEIRIDATASSGRNYKIHSDGDELYIEGIGSSGSLKIGEDGSYGVSIDLGSGVISSASNAGSHTRLLLIKDTGNAGSNRNFIEFHNNSDSTAGRIEHNGSTTVSYITSSDYRLKENVSYDFDATTRLKQLKPARFNFIEEPNKTVDGFLAHEVSDIVPEAISGEKDELQVWKEGEELPEGVSVGDNKLDENGNTIMQIQGIDQSKLVPLLVKTIQELEARIEVLENE
jgi:hypothetical protein